MYSSLFLIVCLFQAIAINALDATSTGITLTLESAEQWKQWIVPYPKPRKTPVLPLLPSTQPGNGSETDET
jgi:hypothetical protein